MGPPGQWRQHVGKEDRRNTPDPPRRRRKSPTGRPRGKGRAGMGVGQAHSTDEAGNDRRGKGPELKDQCQKQRGSERRVAMSLEPPEKLQKLQAALRAQAKARPSARRMRKREPSPRAGCVRYARPVR